MPLQVARATEGQCEHCRMKKLDGNSKGLKKNQIRRIENLYRRRTPPQFILTPELARDISRLSFEINRQLGLLIDRKGRVASVIVGDHHGIVIPQMREYRTAPDRLKGVHRQFHPRA